MGHVSREAEVIPSQRASTEEARGQLWEIDGYSSYLPATGGNRPLPSRPYGWHTIFKTFWLLNTGPLQHRSPFFRRQGQDRECFEGERCSTGASPVLKSCVFFLLFLDFFLLFQMRTCLIQG